MSSTATTITPCQYLFRKDTKALFPAQEAGFVNQSLVTLMKIVDHLVRTNPEALFLFDPTAFNNQCHLYALFVAQAVNQIKIQTVVGSILPLTDAVEPAFLGYTEYVDRRFLYLSFFLSFAFLTDPKLLEKLACKALTVMKSAAPSKEFRLFLKDPGSIRTHASRSALNVLFAEHMQRVFTSGESPLDLELRAVANADLQLAPSAGKGTLYTFPKLAGVAYLIEELFRERIALLFKVKVLTKEGIATFMHSNQNLRALGPTAPVVVFELMATGDSLTYLECHEIAKRCPTHSRRNVSSKDRHKPTERCLFCSPNKVDVAVHRQRFQPALTATNEMLQALGADFVVRNQKPFLGFFSDRMKFPRLTALFEASVPNIERHFLSGIKPNSMSVSHVYTDCAAMALRDALVIDAAYETHLSDRGLV